jgi:polysaccharide biosynthesis transport protein
MSVQQLLRILYARRRVALYTLLGVVAITVIFNLLRSPQYKATAAVVVDAKSPDPFSGIAVSAMAMPGYMATQADIINSDRVARKVVWALGLDQSAKVIEDWRKATQGKGTVDAWLAERLQKKLEVKPSRESDVITISFSSSNAPFAAAIANAFAQAYLETTVELKAEPARQYAAWFESRAKELRGNLARAQKRLADYQQAQGILVSDQRQDSDTAKLAELEAQLVLAQGQRADASSKRDSADSDTLPDLMQNNLVQQLKADVARTDARLHDLAGRLGSKHPQYQAAEAELSALQRRLAEETIRVSRSIETAGRITASKEAQIRANIATLRSRIMGQKVGHIEANVLQQEVETAQKAYESVAQRLSRSNLEGQTQQTNVSVLSPAIEPTVPYSPKKRLNFAIAVFVGTLLGVLAALITEMMDRRFRSREDIAQLLELPVLADLKSR